MHKGYTNVMSAEDETPAAIAETSTTNKWFEQIYCSEIVESFKI